jgi:hypothetical protein
MSTLLCNSRVGPPCALKLARYYTMKSTLVRLGVVELLFALQLTVQAIPYINGSISFNGVPVFDNPSDLSSATAFTAINSVTVAVGQQIGDYAAIPDRTTASFSAFIFKPPTTPLIPLWDVTYNGITWSFDATSMVAHFNSAMQIWNLGGNGIAHMTGEADTPGQWNLTAGKQGISFFLGSGSAAQQVQAPDDGTTGLLLGFALSGLALGRMKWSGR